MKNLFKYYGFFSLLIVSGCASQYVPPDKGETATVTYKSDTNVQMQIFVFDSYECQDPKIIKAFSAEDTEREVTVRVSANKKVINTFRAISLTFTGVGTNTNYFYTTIEFTPEAGGKYLINLSGDSYQKATIKKFDGSGFMLDKSVNMPEKVCKF